jgi:hypothetical protein
MNFIMNITDIFHLQSGETIFAGKIEGGSNPVKPCEAQLFIDDQLAQNIMMSGELLMDGRHPEGYRAISINQPINLTSTYIREHLCQLRGLE